MPFERKYDFATITCYPELSGYLRRKLKKLGKVEVEVYDTLGEPFFLAKIVLKKFPKVDFSEGIVSEILPGSLWINGDAGGCSVGQISITCTGRLPEPDEKEVTFLFDLSLDSRYLPVIKHSAQLIKNSIDSFVRQVQVGFHYKRR